MISALPHAITTDLPRRGVGHVAAIGAPALHLDRAQPGHQRGLAARVLAGAAGFGRTLARGGSRSRSRSTDRDRDSYQPSEPARREDMGSHISSPHAGLIGNRYQPPSDLARCVVVHHGGELRCQGVDGRA
jgi:hypothetical protein